MGGGPAHPGVADHPGWVKYHGITEDELDAVTGPSPGRWPATRSPATSWPTDRRHHRSRAPRRAAPVRLGRRVQARGQPRPAVPGSAAGHQHHLHRPEAVVGGRPAGSGCRSRARIPIPRRRRPGSSPGSSTPTARHPRDLARWLGITPKAARLVPGRPRRRPHRSGGRGGAGLDDSRRRRGRRLRPVRGCVPAARLRSLRPRLLSHRATIPEGQGHAVSRTATDSPVLLVDGHVAGTWRPPPATAAPSPSPFRRLPRTVVAAPHRCAGAVRPAAWARGSPSRSPRAEALVRHEVDLRRTGSCHRALPPGRLGG